MNPGKAARPRLLICGDSPLCTSGFGRVVRALGTRLATRAPEGWEVHCVGVYDPLPPAHDLPIRLWPCPDERRSGQRLAEVMRATAPDALLLFSDVAVCGQWAQVVAAASGGKIPCPVLVYSPVDGGGVVPELTEWLGRDWFAAGRRLATYTEWGRQEMSVALPGEEIGVLPHAADTTVFFPRDRNAARRALGLDPAEFIVLNANTNSTRKRIDATIAGFCRFLRTVPEARTVARLWLHMDPNGAWDVRALMAREARRCGVPERLGLTAADHREMRGVSEETLTVLYAAADVGISTSGGEGWGLCPWEMAAMGKPQVLTDFAAFAEIFPRDGAYFVAPRVFQTAPDHLQEHAVLDPEEVGAALARAWADWRAGDGLVGEAGRRAATAISWEAVAATLDGWLREMLAAVATME